MKTAKPKNSFWIGDDFIDTLMWIERAGSTDLIEWERHGTMTLLIPNTQHPNSNNHDQIFCLPVPFEKWNKWKALSDYHKKQFQGISYFDRVEGGKIATIIMLPDELQSDDDVLTAIAYVRIIEQITCRVHVIRSTYGSEPSRAQIVNAVMGANPDTIMDLDMMGLADEDPP